MMKATRVRDLHCERDGITQVLWELDTEFTWETWKDVPEADRRTRYVVTSASIVPFSGPETYIFPSDSDGHIVDWGELPGSFKGDLNHQQAIEGFCACGGSRE